jgi:signal transduction histidine kinase/FixJ family two-component response regulator
MRVVPAVLTAALVVALLTFLSLRALNPEAELFDVALGELEHFAMIENALYRDVFSARAGMLRNYDPLVHEIRALHVCSDRLRQSAAMDSETAAAVGRLTASVDRQEELVEKFKSDNALMHNSLAFFGRFRSKAPDLEPAISAAAAAMLNLTLDTSEATAREVQDRLDELDHRASPSDRDSVAPLLAHGRLLHDLLPAVDQALEAMRALPRKQEQDSLRSLLLQRQAETRTSARQYRELLYAASLLLVAFLVYLGIQLRARANALQRRAAFEHVIAMTSMRFINAQPQMIGAEIEQALADMARCIGSDRAYFVLSGPEPRLHVWHKPGFDFSPGWPEKALGIAVRSRRTADGIVHFPHVRRMPRGECKSELQAAGLGGWACVANVDKDGSAVVLGFEAIGRPCLITSFGELSLLRMALDTIGYAVGRHAMETERTRLEARLQQARRMEKIGTLTSGIAHNFNNILGGILGHSEVMEEHLGPDARLNRNLGAIRRGAERARDLVDQILVFGQRRDVRRRPLSANGLVTETASLLTVSLRPGIELVIQESRVVALVSGESAQLQQVILNLCNNAAQAMENGGRIEITTELREVTAMRSLTHDELRPGRYVCIVVTDSGHGMDQATLARIFEPFFTTRASGNGLGLATVREIVREHGGAMNVESSPGHGSRFEIWLPSTESSASLPAIAAPMVVQIGSGETVMLVTSDAARLLRDEETLAALGFEPVGFSTAGAALAACRARPDRFDALIVGHFGSTMSSLEIAAALHEVAPHLPIVLATKSSEEIGADRLVGTGIADVVHWPIIAAEVASALNQCTGVRRAEAKPQVDSVRSAFSSSYRAASR